MKLIDWYLVFTSALWILGFSVVLAAFSYHQWEAGVAGRRLREQLRRPSWRVWWAAGMFLVSVGFGLAESSRWWERVAWLVLGCSFGWDAARAAAQLRSDARATGTAHPEPGQ